MKRINDVNLLHFMVWVCLIPPIPLLLLSYGIETTEPVSLLLSTTSKTWLSLVYVSYLSTLVAFAMWGLLLKTYSAAVVTPFALLIPVVGMTTSGLLLGESMASTELAGSALIMIGLLFCVLGEKISRWLR